MRSCNLLKSVLFIGIVSLSLIFTGCKKDKKVTIGFYSNSETITKSMEEMIKEISSQNKIKTSFVILSESSSLEAQIKKNKINAIITPAGMSLKKCIEQTDKDSGIPYELTNNMFSTMREATITNNKKAIGLPLVIDHLEIDIDTQSFNDSGMKAINTWRDIEKFCKSQQKRIENPIAFTGNDAVFLLDLIGAITEAQAGINSYNKAVEILTSEENTGANFKAENVAKQLFMGNNAPLSVAQNYLKKLNSSGYLNPVTREFSNYDIDILAQDRRARVIFTTLSSHRSYNASGISHFSTMYLPSKVSPESRHFTANVTYFVPIQNNGALVSLVEKLYSPENQSDLARKTGLSPVLAHCRTPDKQSDDVRYWISATGTPVAGLGHETSLSKEQLNLLKDEILGLIF